MQTSKMVRDMDDVVPTRLPSSAQAPRPLLAQGEAVSSKEASLPGSLHQEASTRKFAPASQELHQEASKIHSTVGGRVHGFYDPKEAMEMKTTVGGMVSEAHPKSWVYTVPESNEGDP